MRYLLIDLKNLKWIYIYYLNMCYICVDNQYKKTHSLSTAIAQYLHGFINIVCEHFRKFGAELVHIASFDVVLPGIIKHQVDVFTKLQIQKEIYHTMEERKSINTMNKA